MCRLSSFLPDPTGCDDTQPPSILFRTKFPARSLEEPRKAILEGLLWWRGWRSSDWDQRVFRGLLSFLSLWPLPTWLDPGDGDPRPAYLSSLFLYKKPPSLQAPPGCSQHTPGFTARPRGSQKPCAHSPPHPGSSRPQLCRPSAGGGAGSIRVSQSPLISCYKSTCGPVSSINRV